MNDTVGLGDEDIDETGSSINDTMQFWGQFPNRHAF